MVVHRLDVRAPRRAPSASSSSTSSARGLFNLTTGVGYFDIDGESTLRDRWISLAGEPLRVESYREHGDLEHINVYAYAYLNLLKNVTFTLG